MEERASTTADPASDRLAHAVALLGYLGLSLLYLRPIWRLFGSHIPPNPGDPVFNLWVLKWGAHQFRLGLPDFWNAPIFFPAPATITYSDHLLGPAAFFASFTSLFPNPLAAFNTLFLGSFVLCGWTTWWVFRRSGLSRTAAFLGGCVFAFSSFRWDQMSHIQVLLAQWIPLALWSWDRLLAEATWKRAGLFVLFYVLHVTGGSYLAYMIHYPMLAILVCRLPQIRIEPRRILRVAAPAAGVAAAVFVLLNIPYLQSARKLGLERNPLEIRLNSATTVSYVTPSASNFYTDEWFESWRRNENSLFPGLLATGLLLTGAAQGWRRRRQAPLRPLSPVRKAALIALVLLALLGWAAGDVWTWTGTSPLGRLGLGSSEKAATWLLAGGLLALLLRRRWGGNWPLRLSDMDPWHRGLLLSAVFCVLLTFPVFYLPLAKLIPGLSGMRVTARFYAFASLSIAFFAGRTLDALLARMGRRAKAAFALLAAAVLLIEVFPKPLTFHPLPQERDFPEVYHWLAGRDDVRAFLELPLRDDLTAISYMYFGTLHWKPMINGYSGYLPADYYWLRENCCWPAPGGSTLERLRSLGMSHIVVHEDKLGKWKRDALEEWEREEAVRLVHRSGDARVYQVLQ
ncbi:MAG TPA: hypothetical protein VEL74_11005 [Thermoanaerobaculia bacterium]|nr:hypothetical protein [Thermoanaerobaculia bacterium]